ncbi:hypothetical protein Q8791_09535 [Nocardiopsis sp. CT-R113]|uniref:Uncharacterized protein n=1 Tax=Nocardiopsis codii TaxID=3065942 RepID=A0ABU7K5D8_9ACTN|nr:hypothetical protein [Nocardiopsis sp. CT-R113]MEE2037460.1 hypothetical protein [Nocardiopsis sp. CT-R113]
MRRIIAALALTVAALGITAAPASADDSCDHLTQGTPPWYACVLR